MIYIEDLHAEIEGKSVLNGINLVVKAGEVHAIMGPNGAGKSSLSRIIAGHPAYNIRSGSIEYEINLKKKNLLDMGVHERALNGIFMSFQYPVEVNGLSNMEFLRSAFNELSKFHGSEELDALDFAEFAEKKIKALGMNTDLLERELNVAFSGGEKKQNEIIQMAILSPRLCFLDETDSGLDIDALRTVASGIESFTNKHRAIVIITHYHRILEYVNVDKVHILKDGRIVSSGDSSLAKEIEKHGYKNLG